MKNKTGVCKEDLDWMRSRPNSIKKLMRKFPPACKVILKNNAPLCDVHEHKRNDILQVVSYREEGLIGVAPSYEKLECRHYMKPNEIEITAFVNEQNHQWVKSILNV